MRLQFNAKPGIPYFEGPGGKWHNGAIKDVPDDMADRLLNLYNTPFSKVEEKQIDPESNKMISAAPEKKDVPPEPPKLETFEDLAGANNDSKGSKKKR